MEPINITESDLFQTYDSMRRLLRRGPDHQWIFAILWSTLATLLLIGLVINAPDNNRFITPGRILLILGMLAPTAYPGIIGFRSEKTDKQHIQKVKLEQLGYAESVQQLRYIRNQQNAVAAIINASANPRFITYIVATFVIFTKSPPLITIAAMVITLLITIWTIVQMHIHQKLSAEYVALLVYQITTYPIQKEASHDPDTNRGLYRRYTIERLDDPDGKHEDCPVFVLDLRHDPYAQIAIRTYIHACGKTHPYLARDLSELLEQEVSASLPAALERYR